MYRLPALCFVTVILFSPAAPLHAEEPSPKHRIGFLGSLSGIAASYGSEALDGVRLALNELPQGKRTVALEVEDDASDMKSSVTAYRKLRAGKSVDAVLAATWWANAVVKIAEAENVPLLSVETSFNNDTVLGDTYFLMLGDLRDWLRVFEPLIDEQGWKRGAVIHFTSGFGQTLAAEMQRIFSEDGRSLVADLEYADIDASEARALAARLKAANPDVVYIDGQPQNLALLLKRMHEIGLADLPVLTNSIAQDMCQNKLFDCGGISRLYFNKRKTLHPEFVERFEKAYGRKPYLDADVAYYTTKLLLRGIEQGDPVRFLKNGEHQINGVKLSFDSRNVAANLEQELWQIERGAVTRLRQ